MGGDNISDFDTSLKEKIYGLGKVSPNYVSRAKKLSLEKQIELCCDGFGMTKKEEQFYSTYNPTKLGGFILEMGGVPRELYQELRQLIVSKYEPFFDELVVMIRRTKTSQNP
ncbi:MAG: hypothetical protein ABIA78_02005 [archaeon]